MNETKKGIINQIWTCTRSPRKGFESVGGEDLWRGAVLILLVASLSAFAGFNYASKTPIQLFIGSIPIVRVGPHGQPFDPEAIRKNFVILSTLGNGLTLITGWLVTTVILHIFARLLVGNGSLKRLLAFTGFASIPLMIQQILRLIDAYTISGQNLVGLLAVRVLGQTLPLRFTSQFLRIFTVFGIWSFALTIVAVSVNYEGSQRRAATATALAYLIFAVLRVFLPV